ncbi:MAG: alanine racemase [Deltaproteobacteria bacterium]
MASGQMQVNLGAIAANWRALDALTGPGIETSAVVKADAYGLGIKPVVRALASAGVRRFFVAQAHEAQAIREEVGHAPDIFVLTGHMAGDTEAIRGLDLIPMLNSFDQMTRHFEALPGHAFGLQLETGMHRLGIGAAEWSASRDLVAAAGPKLIISHLACADDPHHPLNAVQLRTFISMTEGLPTLRSLAATGGILLGPDYHFDLVRPGIGLFGALPFDKGQGVVRLSLPVVQVVEVGTGSTVGYGATWVARRPSRIVTLASGYADGIFRSLSGKPMLFHGRTACPLVGRVSMDLLTIDITHLTEVPDSLDLICEHQSVDQLAAQAGTIGYEILTSLGQRYDRIYS